MILPSRNSASMNTLEIIEKIFGENGPIAEHLPRFEPRLEQIRMSAAVCKAIYGENNLIVEAGTGVGKSLAYLVPLIYWAVEQNTRVVISTYTKALQQQLTEKDIPFLQKALGLDFSCALCVGSQNYLCRRRLERTGQRGFFDSGSEEKQLDDIFEWSASKTDTGLFQEMDFEISESLRYKVCRESDLCMGNKCAHNEDCFYRRAKKREFAARVLVTNHHMFFANLSAGERILPEYDAVVFDEAHSVEEVATDHLGAEISSPALKFLFDSIAGTRPGRGFISRIEHPGGEKAEDVIMLTAAARKAADAFFSNVADKFPEDENIFRIRAPNFVPNNLTQPLAELAAALKSLADSVRDTEDKKEIGALSMRAVFFAKGAQAVISQEQEGYVFWAEAVRKKNPRFSVHALPVDISGLMREKVFDGSKPVVLTSATLSAGNSFAFIRERLGIENAEELMLGSPFNFIENALLYVPRSMPDPGKETGAYTLEVTSEIEKILDITRGSTFVLFTSYKMMEKVYESLKETESVEILCQGIMPRYKMLEKFRKGLKHRKEGKGFALFGTMTFWQGVDVPGKALECVIITKLPFAVPDDPVTEAKTEMLQAEGKDPFVYYHIPRAVVLLRQGFGRLIRTKEDKGMVAILDPRLRTRYYGRIFINSLPECRIAEDLSEVRDFFKSIRI